MFDLPCGVRLRAFERSQATSSPSDLDSIIGIYNDPMTAPLVTQRFIVPRGQKLKDEFLKAIEEDAEMFCVIESIPQISASTKDPVENAVEATAAGDPQNSLSSKFSWGHEVPQFLGFTALWNQAERGHRHSSFSLVILPAYQDRGLGTIITQFIIDHAFVHLNMHRISLSAYEGNDRAMAVYRKCGFIDEGRLRKAYWVAGKWKDYINMGMLIDDWEARKSQKQVTEAH